MDLDTLGKRHRKLLADLDECRTQLAVAMRTERGNGATLVDIMQRSGYTSLETVRHILDPTIRERNNKARRRPKD
jgi:hypothetical protein